MAMISRSAKPHNPGTQALQGALQHRDMAWGLQVYDVDSVRALLLSLRQEAIAALLFLKSIQRLEVYEWRPGRIGA